MAELTAPLARLIEQLEHLPGIGHKSAQRLAFYLLTCPQPQTDALVHAIDDARTTIRECDECGNWTDQPLCSVCRQAGRDHDVICVVEDPRDVMAIERAREFHGVYHVLHGALSPMDNIGPDKLRIQPLLDRVSGGHIREVIMATNPTVEGEATAMYLNKLLAPLKVPVTRLAYGIPVGGDLEYADEITLRHSLEGRSPL